MSASPPTHGIRLALLTWNVGGAPAGIAPGTTTLLRCAANADVIIVGLQEVSVGRRGWKTHLAKALGSNWRYIGGESLAGIRLKAFARLRPDGRPTATVSGTGMKVGAGFAARWPNKGAVAVEMHFSPSCRVLFVVAHLAANEHHIEDRADDWRAILRRLDRDSSHISGISEPVIPLFLRYEHVFVLGDLNYRIEAPGDARNARVDWVQQRVDARDWSALLTVDQLTRERNAGRVFANFQEAPINFPPTFKIDPRTGRYSRARVPSYCDRILWHSLPARVDLVANRRYEPLPEFRQSDHVPVVAEFDLSVPILPSPRTSSMPKGLRPVLEFMMVRFIKGRPSEQLMQRHRLSEGHGSLRRLSKATPSIDRKNPEKIASRTPALLASRAIHCRPDDGEEEDDEHDEDDDDDDLDSDEEDDCTIARIRDEFDDDDLADDDDETSTSTDSHDTDLDEHYSHNFDNGSDLYSPYEGAEDMGTTAHRPPAPADRATTPVRRKHGHARRDQVHTVENGGGSCSHASVRQFAQRSSGDISSAFDEELLADMLTRMSASASSSTDNSTPVSTPRGAGNRTNGDRAGIRKGSGCEPGTSGSSGQTDGTGTSGTSSDRHGEDGCETASGAGGGSSTAGPVAVHTNSVPLKRDSLSRQVVGERQKHGKTKRRSRLNGVHMEVHGHGLFLKRNRVYRVSIPKRRNGARERIGDSLPAIPLAAVGSLDELTYRHVLVVFARMKSKVGTSGALPLRELVAHQGEPYAFEMVVTKYGEPIGTVEACVQLTVKDAGCWVDARGKVVRNFDGGSNKGYRGSLQVRRRARARSKPGPVR